MAIRSLSTEQELEDFGLPILSGLSAPDSAPTTPPSPALNSITAPAPASASPEDKTAIAEKLAQQILKQGTTSQWSGQGFGSAEANARDMARILADTGITDIKQFGQFEAPVQRETMGDLVWTKTVDPYSGSETWGWVPKSEAPEEKALTYGNKETKQAVANTYGERQADNAWGGTYAGSGNTGYRVQFGPDGTPYFYTTGASSSDLQDIAPLLQLAAMIPSPIQPFAQAANAAIAIDQGNVLGGLSSIAGIPGVSEAANAAGLGAAISGLQTAGKLNNLVKSIESGNILGTLTSGANLAGAGNIGIGDTGYKVSDALKLANLANAAKQGNFLPLVGSFAQSGSMSGPKASDFDVGSMGSITGSFDPSKYGYLGTIDEINAYNASPLDALSGDYSFSPNYSLFPEENRDYLLEMGGAQGIEAPSLPNVFNEDGSINYDLYTPTETGGEPSFKMPRTPNIESMGGGQGITFPVEGGTMTESGLVPYNYLAPLGDPESFINKPAPGGDVSDAVQKAISTPSGGQTASRQDKSSKASPTKVVIQQQSKPDTSIPWLNTTAQMLGSTSGAGSQKAAATKLAQLRQIYDQMTPELANVFADRGIVAPDQYGLIMASGGSTKCALWGELKEYAPKFQPTLPSMLQGSGSRRNPLTLSQLKQLYGKISQYGNMDEMARGGLPTKYQEAAPDGHHPEFVTGLTGYYAGGRGTGQSDDIPAMLHDGDYVIDAEAVSALGDGSSKAGKDALTNFLGQIPHRDGAEGKPVPAKIADGEFVLPEAFVTALGGGDNKRGAQMLDTMRERLRAHKRSAPTSKIPPKALSPVDYLKKAK